MIVHLLRHAKTEVFSNTGKDFDRKLAPKGHQQCLELKALLSKVMGEETKIFSSSARRTRETARFIFDDQQEILFFDELYLAGKDDLMAFISNREEVKEILIIGHNFGISELASYYTGKQILLKTGGFVSIDFPDFSVNELSASIGIIKANHRCTIDY